MCIRDSAPSPPPEEVSPRASPPPIPNSPPQLPDGVPFSTAAPAAPTIPFFLPKATTAGPAAPPPEPTSGLGELPDFGPTSSQGLLGQRVVIGGLKARPDLNGREGEVTSFNAGSGRYVVNITDETVALRPANLHPIGGQPPPAEFKADATMVSPRRVQPQEQPLPATQEHSEHSGR
eukprot:115070-Prymnesium_polylepis.1